MAIEINLAQQIACLKREIALRKNVYPKSVRSDRMRQSEADYEIAAMTAALHSLTDLAEKRAADLWRKEHPDRSVFDCDEAEKDIYRNRALVA